MANISDKIQSIRQALFGKDVRENIASGIEAINEEVESTTQRQTTLETNMAQAEAVRVSSEQSRVTKENERLANETARQTAETQRVTEVNAIKAAYDGATKANTSVEVFNARHDNINNKDYANLPARLDDHSSQLNDIMYQVPLFFDSTLIQNLLNTKRKIQFLDGQYILDKPIFYKGNSNIILSPTTEFVAKAGCFPLTTDCLTYIVNESNIRIQGKLKLTMQKAEYTSGEWRHGLSILSGKNIEIDEIEVANTGGDGVYFGSNDNISLCENIKIGTIKTDNCKRNGVSFVCGRNVIIDTLIAKNTIGTDPAFGVDFEPNYNTNLLQNIIINNLYTENNDKGGLEFAIGQLKDTTESTSILINNYYSKNDGKVGGMRFAYNNNVGDTSQLAGSIVIKRAIIENPDGRGVDFYNYSSKAVEIILEKCLVINPASDLSLTDNFDLSGYTFQTYSGETATKVGNIKLVDCKAIDTRTTARMFLPFHFASSAKLLEKIKIVNPYGENQTNASNGMVVIGKGDYEVIYDVKPKKSFSASGNIGNYYGYELTNSNSSAINLTLPLASDYKNATFTFRYTTGTITVLPQSGDIINVKGCIVGTGIVARDNNCLITLKSNGVSWDIVNIAGFWTPSGYANQPKILYSNTMPTSGDFLVGDIVYTLNRSIQGTSPNKYILLGWSRQTNGNTHVLNADWVEMRVLNGQ